MELPGQGLSLPKLRFRMLGDDGLAEKFQSFRGISLADECLGEPDENLCLQIGCQRRIRQGIAEMQFRDFPQSVIQRGFAAFQLLRRSLTAR